MAKERKWIKRLINKITRFDAPVNNSFKYYGYDITQTSSTTDYTALTILWDNREVADFSFDFFTLSLHFVSYADDDIRMDIVKAFLSFYGRISVTDETLDERRKMWQYYLDNPEEYDEDVLEEVRKEIDLIDRLPMGKVDILTIKNK